MSQTRLVRPITEPRPAANSTGYLFLPARWRRARVLVWLRRVHGWLGLWGGVAGMLFGATGILLNHRAQMPIDAVKTQQTIVRLSLPGERPASPEALGQWVKGELGLRNVSIRVKRDAPRSVAWSEKPLIEPEHWQVTLWNPARVAQADYWLGMPHVNVRQTNGNGFSLVTRMHMAEGVHAGWIIVADTVAGGLVALALSGILLWTRLHGPRLLAVAIAVTVATLLGTFGMMSL
jgi:uncharacterized protein